MVSGAPYVRRIAARWLTMNATVRATVEIRLAGSTLMRELGINAICPSVMVLYLEQTVFSCKVRADLKATGLTFQMSIPASNIDG
jgi:hypothetical protein